MSTPTAPVAPDSGWKTRMALFLGSQTLSLFGSSLVQYAIIWHITLSTGSGSMLSLSTLCGFGPQLLISLYAGAWLDRFSRKQLIMLADGGIALTTLLLAVLFWLDMGSLWMLFAALIVRSAGSGIQTPAVQALIPQLAPPEALGRINGLHGALNALTNFLAPAASALLLTLSPRLENVFVVDVVTAALAIGVLGCLAVPVLQREKSTAREDLRAGFAYLRARPDLQRLFAFQAAVLTLISPAAFLTPLLVSRTFGPELWLLSASEMTYSAGAVAGGLLMAAWGGWKFRLRTVYAAGGVYSVGMLGMGLVPLFPAYLLCNALMGVASPCYGSALTTHLQETVQPHLHGRIFAFMQIANGCAFPLGMLLFGPLADTFSLHGLFVFCGVAVLLLTLSMARTTRSGTTQS